MVSLFAAGCTRGRQVSEPVTVFEFHQNGWQQITRPIVVRSANQWRQQLGEMGYFVLRQGGTEKPFANRFHAEARVLAGGAGLYRCKGCQLPLFWARDQFLSSSGWPSFYRPAQASNVRLRADEGRTEVRCRSCDGHLGHVFDDGIPAPANPTSELRRFCINSAALQFDA